MCNHIRYIISYLKSREYHMNISEFETQNVTALHIAAFYGDINVISYLIKYTKTHSPHDNFKCTPLHYAILGRNIEIVKILLAAGADISIVDNNNYDALNYSIYCNHDEITTLLINHIISLKYKN